LNYEARALTALIKNQDMMQALSANAATLFVSHKDIWEFVYGYYRSYREVPASQVVLEQFDGFEFESELEGATGHHLNVLRTQKTKQELDRLIEGASEALDDGHSAQSVLEHLVERTAMIQRNGGITRSVDVRDTDEACREFERRRELAALHGGQIGIPTGFKYIDDNYATGFAPGHFVVGLGYSGLGKTWFIIQLAINAWLKGYKPMIINLEMSPEELRDRIYFLISQYKMDELVRAEIDPDDFERWAKDYMEGKVEFLLFGNEGFGSFTTDMVAGKIEQYKPDIVFCDYLQLFSDRANSTNDVTRARATAREFKELAQASMIPIVVISAVTGKDKKDRLVAPSLAQVAWSSEIEYAANLAFAVHTHRDPITQKAKETEIVLLKNRHGGLASFNVKMDLDVGTITEIEPDEMLAWQDDDEDPMAKLMNKVQ
jgi:replicative DNA helicase